MIDGLHLETIHKITAQLLSSGSSSWVILPCTLVFQPRTKRLFEKLVKSCVNRLEPANNSRQKMSQEPGSASQGATFSPVFLQHARGGAPHML